MALHGWLDNAASFDALAPLLTWARVVAVDLPGHGWSAHRPVGASYAFVDWVPEVFAVADALGWQDFLLLGHSMGGAIASLAAGTLPERIQGLLLIDALGSLTAEATEAPERLARHIAAAIRLQDKAPPRYESREAALAARLRAGDFETPDGIGAVVDRGLEATQVAGRACFQWRADARLTLPSALRLTREQVAAFLARITCPTLLVKPTDGLTEVARELASFIAVVPSLEVAETAGRHHVHLDRPDAVATLINDFHARRLRSSR